MKNPLFGWFGGKSKTRRYIIPVIKMYYDYYKCDNYIEPFCGSCAVFLGLDYEKAVLNDINHDLIITLNEIKKNPAALFKALYHQPHSRYLFDQHDSVLKTRMRGNMVATNFDIACSFIYCYTFGFSGLGATLGRTMDVRALMSPKLQGGLKDLDSMSQHLRSAIIQCGTYYDVNKHVTPTSMIYCDPPYLGSTAGYQHSQFDDSDYERFIDWVFEQPCPVIVSNYKNDYLDRLPWTYTEYFSTGLTGGSSVGQNIEAVYVK
jgi:DNA adenine methylase